MSPANWLEFSAALLALPLSLTLFWLGVQGLETNVPRARARIAARRGR